MRVWFCDAGPDLSFEAAILGDELVLQDPDVRQLQVLVVHQTRVDADLLDAWPALRGVIRLGVGYDKLDLAACRLRGVQATHVPDYCTDEVADTTLALILNFVRGTRELESRLRERPEDWQSLSLQRIRRCNQLTLGVIGAGRIGSAVLARARAFGFRRLFYDPFVSASEDAVPTTDLQTLLQQSDLVSLHLPLSDETRGLVNAAFLAQMKPGACLINTARGGLMADESAWLAALHNGRVGALLLDVLPVEPPEQESLFQAWLQHADALSGRLLIQPHQAFYSREAAVAVRRQAAQEALHFLRGKGFRYPLC
ncbi:MAG: C-terminal binding protein [Candidatus Sericytochromatia bacterium]|nr:C-terminal binding protein [Candidatus Sericytochromatia bacterium]